jgi:Tol biopolymer transport system component
MSLDGTKQAALTMNTASGSGSDSPVWSPNGSKIAFGSRVFSLTGANIFVMNGDGSAVTPLTRLTVVGAFGPAFCDNPSWAPDGSKIAYMSNRALDGTNAINGNGITNVWVMNADGSASTPLTQLVTITSGPLFVLGSPQWSPDNTKIVFVSDRSLDGSNTGNPVSNNVWVINADGTGLTPLTTLTAIPFASELLTPVWSPSGSKIAFASARALDGSNAPNTNNVSNIWVMNADGSNASPLTKLINAGSVNPVWSPDGTKIAFASSRALDGSDANNTNGTPNIWVINVDGSGGAPLTRLTANGVGSGSPQWSPDGTKIVFVSQRAIDGSNAPDLNTTFNIWVVNADGSSTTPLTKLDAAGANSQGPNLLF